MKRKEYAGRRLAEHAVLHRGPALDAFGHPLTAADERAALCGMRADDRRLLCGRHPLPIAAAAHQHRAGLLPAAVGADQRAGDGAARLAAAAAQSVS